MARANEQKVLVRRLEKTAVDYVLRPRLGTWLKLFTALLGRVPPEEHAWIVIDEVPPLVRFEGPLYMEGPVWRFQLTSPRWPKRPQDPLRPEELARFRRSARRDFLSGMNPCNRRARFEGSRFRATTCRASAASPRPRPTPVHL
jgi:hypothetical protein